MKARARNLARMRGAEMENIRKVDIKKKRLHIQLLQLVSSIFFSFQAIQNGPDCGRHGGVAGADRARRSRGRVGLVNLGAFMG